MSEGRIETFGFFFRSTVATRFRLLQWNVISVLVAIKWLK